MCMANLVDDNKEYIRSLFIGTFVAPLTIIAYLFVKSGQELQRQESPSALPVFQARTKENRASYSRQSSNASNDVALSIQSKRGRESSATAGTLAFSGLSAVYDFNDAELDVQKEKRTQRYLILMVSSFAVCLTPLMILRLMRSAVQETKENARHVDIAFLIFVWIDFLPALLIPCLYASWQMSRPTKDRLLRYFGFTNRRPIQAWASRDDDDGRPHRRRSLELGSRFGSSSSGDGSISTTAVVLASSAMDSRSARSGRAVLASGCSPLLNSAASFGPARRSSCAPLPLTAAAAPRTRLRGEDAGDDAPVEWRAPAISLAVV